MQIKPLTGGSWSGQRVSMDDFDRMRTGDGVTGRPNQITVVDITGGKYGKAYLLSGDPQDPAYRDGVECLGIVPVLVGSANAMFFQGLISSDLSVSDDGVESSVGI